MISSDLSDEHVLHLRSKWEVSERVPEPLEMSDTEIVDWLNEYCKSLYYFHASSQFELTGDYPLCRESTVRAVVCKAAAHHKEANRDF